MITPFRRLRAGACAAALALLPMTAQAQTGPFAGLAGAWSGSGKIIVKQGESENVRCRATYTVTPTGAELNQVLRCASDSYRFDLTTNVTASGNSLYGSWNETSRNLTGTMNGKINGDRIEALVEANGFAASLSMQTGAKRQTIAIRSQNTEIRGVEITLTR